MGEISVTDIFAVVCIVILQVVGWYTLGSGWSSAHQILTVIGTLLIAVPPTIAATAIFVEDHAEFIEEDTNEQKDNQRTSIKVR